MQWFRTMTPEQYAAAYSANFGKPMTVEEAAERLADLTSRRDSNAKDDARVADMHAKGYVLTQEGYVLKSEVDARAAKFDADINAALDNLNLTDD